MSYNIIHIISNITLFYDSLNLGICSFHMLVMRFLKWEFTLRASRGCKRTQARCKARSQVPGPYPAREKQDAFPGDTENTCGVASSPTVMARVPAPRCRREGSPAVMACPREGAPPARASSRPRAGQSGRCGWLANVQAGGFGVTDVDTRLCEFKVRPMFLMIFNDL
jgi:hypothetical protein